MQPEDRRHEIKEILKEATFWCQGSQLDLAVEQIQSLLDRDRVRGSIVKIDFQNERRGLGEE